MLFILDYRSDLGAVSSVSLICLILTEFIHLNKRILNTLLTQASLAIFVTTSSLQNLARVFHFHHSTLWKIRLQKES